MVIEETNIGYSTYSLDLPDCISMGRTHAEVERNMHQAIEFHVESLQLAGYPAPETSSSPAFVQVAVA